VTGVLVCDDAPDMRDMLREALDADPGLRVVGEAADGADTLRLAEALQPDVVLLDLGMPGPEPADVVTGVRRLAPGAAIVILSGYGAEHVGPHVARDIVAHLSKTTPLDTVRRTVREAGGAPPCGASQ
jgi:DNA-binding NarL/FixJ family response regulator